MFKAIVLACFVVLSTEAQSTRSQNKILKESENDVLENEIRREFYVFPAYLRGKFGKRKVGYLVFSNMEITKPRFLSLQDKRFREGLELIKSPGIYRGKSAEKAFSRLFASKFYRKPSFKIRQGIILPKGEEKSNPSKEKLEQEKKAVVESISRGENINKDRNGSDRDSSVLEVDPNVELAIFDSGPVDEVTVKEKKVSKSINSNDRSVHHRMINLKRMSNSENKSKIDINRSKVIIQFSNKNNTELKLQERVNKADENIRELNNSETHQEKVSELESKNSQGSVKIDQREIINMNKSNTTFQMTDKILSSLKGSNKNVPASSMKDKIKILQTIDASHDTNKSGSLREENANENPIKSNPPIISKGILVGKRVDKNVPFSSILNLGNYIYFTGQNNTNISSRTLPNRPNLQPNLTDDISHSTHKNVNSSFSKTNGLLLLDKTNSNKTQSQLKTYIIRFDDKNSKVNNSTNGVSKETKAPAAIIVSYSDLFDSGLAEGLSRSLNVSLVEGTNVQTDEHRTRMNIAKALGNISLNSGKTKSNGKVVVHNSTITSNPNKQ